MEYAMFFWRVLTGSFLVDVIPADIIGVNFSGLALILLTQGVSFMFLNSTQQNIQKKTKMPKKIGNSVCQFSIYKMVIQFAQLQKR